MRSTGTYAGTTIERRRPEDGAWRAFSRGWLAELESLVVGAAVPGVEGTRQKVQLICAERDRVSPWVVEVADGRVRRVRWALTGDVGVAVVHSPAVGWRMLGRRVQEFHRVGELVVEQLEDGTWTRHPIPPLDDGVVDLARRAGEGAVTWHERVIGTPIGTVFVSRRLAGGRLWIVDASTRPPSEPSGVGSDVEWSDVMAARVPTNDTATERSPFRRFWRGPTDSTSRIRSLLAAEDLDGANDPDRLERDRALLDTLGVLAAVGSALRAGATWRRLLRHTSET